MPEISLIIPCYNEQERLPCDAILGFVKSNGACRLLLVNDGSMDETQAVIEKLASSLPERIHYLRLPKNQGKAEAVRQGILFMYQRYPCTWYGFWDADLSTPLEEIGHFLNCAGPNTQFLIGSRVKRMGAIIERKAWRHISGRIMATLISWTLRQPVYDTQCGAKLIHHKEVETAFSAPFLSRWLFDVEILVRILQNHPEQSPHDLILEVPLFAWKEKGGSKLTILQIAQAVMDLARIRRWLRKKSGKADNEN